jgi:CRP-like cAMP-binding protein
MLTAVRDTIRPVLKKSFMQRLEASGGVTGSEMAILEAALYPPETYLAGDEMHPPTPAAPPFFILSGWACLARFLSDGRRQILAFLLPGDSIGFDLLTQPRTKTTVMALTPVKIQRVRPSLRTELANCPGVSRALAVGSALQQARLIDHVVRLGRQTAYERCAHLLLELHGRLEEVGEAQNDSFRLPVKQEILADGLGLSLVHINRTLQQLRRDKLAEIHGGAATLRDREALIQISEYQPSLG